MQILDHANYIEEVNVVVKWLRNVKDEQFRKELTFGLCGEVSWQCKSLLVENHSIYMYAQCPINDTTSGLSPAEQYGRLPHYKGRQLELRIEYAEYLIDYFNESIRI